jgi:hypothetical protein
VVSSVHKGTKGHGDFQKRRNGTKAPVTSAVAWRQHTPTPSSTEARGWCSRIYTACPRQTKSSYSGTPEMRLHKAATPAPLSYCFTSDLLNSSWQAWVTGSIARHSLAVEASLCRSVVLADSKQVDHLISLSLLRNTYYRVLLILCGILLFIIYYFP